MILHNEKGRLKTKWLGLGQFEASGGEEFLHLHLSFTIPTKNGTQNETAMAVIGDYRKKRFIVELVAGPVNCRSTDVVDLMLLDCEGNIQIKKFPA